jgi:hypothetical protein
MDVLSPEGRSNQRSALKTSPGGQFPTSVTEPIHRRIEWELLGIRTLPYLQDFGIAVHRPRVQFA